MPEISGKISFGISDGGCVPVFIPKDYDDGLFCGNIYGSGCDGGLSGDRKSAK